MLRHTTSPRLTPSIQFLLPDAEPLMICTANTAPAAIYSLKGLKDIEVK
jgi:hypothetical protein